MVNMIAHHRHIHDPPALHSVDLLARANLDRALDRQSFLGSVHKYPNDAVSDLQDNREVPGFSALITGIAIVHTTGMPVAYSFGLACKQLNML